MRALLKLMARHFGQDEYRHRLRWAAIYISILTFGSITHVAAMEPKIPTNIIFISRTSNNIKCIIISDLTEEVDSRYPISKGFFLHNSQWKLRPANIYREGLLCAARCQKGRRCGFHDVLRYVLASYINMRWEWQEGATGDINHFIGWRNPRIFTPHEYSDRLYGCGRKIVVGVIYDWMIRENIGAQLAFFAIRGHIKLTPANYYEDNGDCCIYSDQNGSNPSPFKRFPLGLIGYGSIGFFLCIIGIIFMYKGADSLNKTSCIITYGIGWVIFAFGFLVIAMFATA